MNILYISGMLGILFVLLSLPSVYLFLDGHIPHRYIRFTYDNCPGLPSTKGIVFQGVVFFLLAYGILYMKTPSPKKIETSESSSNTILKTSPTVLK